MNTDQSIAMLDRNKHTTSSVYWFQFINSPWHSLNEAFTEMVEGYCHLHCLVLYIGVTVAQKHHLHQFQFHHLVRTKSGRLQKRPKESRCARDSQILHQYPQHMQPTTSGQIWENNWNEGILCYTTLVRHKTNQFLAYMCQPCRFLQISENKRALRTGT